MSVESGLGNIQSPSPGLYITPPGPYATPPGPYDETSPLLVSRHVSSPVGGEEEEKGGVERSDQHKNKDFQLILVPKSTVSRLHSSFDTG